MGNSQLLCISFCGAVVTLDALIILHAQSFIANPPIGSFFASLLKQRAHFFKKNHQTRTLNLQNTMNSMDFLTEPTFKHL